jgi:RNA-directed DNA polymerase
MIKTPITLQDLRRKLYVKAKAEPQWRFWGLYVHVCKMETLRAAYEMAKTNEGAAGSDGVTFEAIEAQGVEAFLGQIQSELQRRCYVPRGLGGRRYRKRAATSFALCRYPASGTAWCKGRSS